MDFYKPHWLICVVLNKNRMYYDIRCGDLPLLQQGQIIQIQHVSNAIPGQPICRV